MTDPFKIFSFFVVVRKLHWEQIPKNIPLGKIFWEWMATTELFPVGYSFNPISLKGEVVPYEISFNLSNASDCVDWMKDNDKNLNDFIIPKINLTNKNELVTI